MNFLKNFQFTGYVKSLIEIDWQSIQNKLIFLGL